MARGHDSSASVSSGAGQNDNPCFAPVCAKTLNRHLGKVPASVLHHLEKIGARFFHRNSIDLAHLIGRDGRDLHARWSPETYCGRALRIGS
jgi:hypothetical protein